MQVEILYHTKSAKSAGEELQFKLSNVDNSFANGLRRVITAEIPCVAIDRCTVFANTSVFFDEMLVHRLGLVPIWAEDAVRHLVYPRDCTCQEQGCSKCQIRGRLSVRCPRDKHKVNVFSSDLKFEEIMVDADEFDGTNKKDEDYVKVEVGDKPSRVRPLRIHPVASSEEGVWLLSLGRCQEVDIQFYVRKGIAKEHAKWMTVGTVAMRYESDVRIPSSASFLQLSEADTREWVSRCPAGVFDYDEADGQVRVVAPEKCIFCMECQRMEAPFNQVPEPLAIVRQKKNAEGLFSFVFTVESNGQLPVISIVLTAVDVLTAKLRKVQASMAGTLMPGEARGEYIPTRPVGPAATAPRVANDDVRQRQDIEDDLKYLNIL